MAFSLFNSFSPTFLVGGDLDFDVDFDGEPDFGLGDILSFKGLIHFAMGFSGWLMLAGKVTLTTLAIASVIGFTFIVILYYAYRLCLKFNSEPQIKSGEGLVGKEVSISVQISEMEYSENCITESGYIPLDRCRLSKPTNHTIKCGDILHIDSYKSGHVEFNKNYAQLGVLIGWVYHFKTSNGTRSFKAYDITSMNNEINSLRKDLAKKPTEIVKEVVKTEVVTNTIGNTVIFFAQNSAKLTRTAMSELSKIPSGSKVSIIGSASPEGSSNYNQKLSEKRAKAVSKFLTGNGVIVENCIGTGVTDTTSGRVAIVTIK